MPTIRRRDLDAEFAAWLAMVKDGQQPAAKLNELFEAREAARAVKDKRPPIGDETSERINRALTGLGY
jgi:hypothetical protein